MARPIDSVIQTQRLEMIDNIIRTLQALPRDIDSEPLERLEEHKQDLVGLQSHLLQFSRLGDKLAHSLYVQLGDAIIKIDYAIQKVRLSAPIKKTIYTTNWHTLQFVAQKYYGSERFWHVLIPVNSGIRYSTDLLDADTINVK